MPLPLGRANTSCPLSQSSRSVSHDPFENLPVSSRAPAPCPLSQSGAPLSSNTRLSPAPQHSTSPRSAFLFPEPATGELSPRTSPNSSAMNSPLPSRSPSPFLPFYSSGPSSASDTDSDEPGSPLLLDTYSTLREGRPRWWNLRKRSRRGPRRPSRWGYRSMVRFMRRVFRHPFFPKHPSTIVRLPCIILFLLPVFD